MITQSPTYRCVVTFQYANGPFEVASQPRSQDDALRLFNWHVKLNGHSPRAVQARVYTEQDYEAHRRGGAK